VGPGPESLATMRPTYQVTELLGDGIGPELSNAVHALA
jgi:isocitrate dehydrogenase (NAD+)